MKISLITLGTRGDLQPFVALALGLRSAGYDVQVISAKNDAAFVGSFGLAHHALDVDIEQLMAGPEAQEMAQSDSPLKFFLSHVRGPGQFKQTMQLVLAQIWAACQDADALVYHPGWPIGYFMARKLGIPGILASPFPVTATADYPAVLFYAGPRLGRWYNRATHFVFERAFWLISRTAVKAFWASLPGTAAVPLTPPTTLQAASGMPVLGGYSELFFPRPADWPANAHVTGAWPLASEPGWVPPAGLTEFLAAGPPPVYIGFGSLKDPARFRQTLRVLVRALALAGQRAIIALGWNHLDADEPLPATVYLLGSAPHAWLFARVAAVVHHGGAGTTWAGLAAGRPTVVIPHTADQPAWGRRVFELGAGPRPIPKKQLTAEKLAKAITQALAPAVVAQAARLGTRLRTEDGVAHAVRVVSDYLKSPAAKTLAVIS